MLVLMDSEEEDPLAETAGETAVVPAASLANGRSTGVAESSHSEAPTEITLEETRTEAQATM
ncbi:Conserved oligomeric Golgi complex subunit 6 [Varanus komodoensis]|nr:Conserved oligomeric Golgi complex subunit 6 [Varanus komodoensis]